MFTISKPGIQRIHIILLTFCLFPLKKFFWGYRIQLYQYNVGGRLGNLVFAWKIAEVINKTLHYKTVTEIEKMIPKFECRVTAKIMRENYANIAAITPAIRRNIAEFLTRRRSRVTRVRSIKLM